jgi:hypothetical protein
LRGRFRVYLWNVEFQTDASPAWQPIDRWYVTDHDGSARYCGFKLASYAGAIDTAVSMPVTGSIVAIGGLGDDVIRANGGITYLALYWQNHLVGEDGNDTILGGPYSDAIDGDQEKTSCGQTLGRISSSRRTVPRTPQCIAGQAPTSLRSIRTIRFTSVRAS